MVGKIGQITMVVVGVVVCYLLLLVVMPVLTETANTSIATMNVTSNMSNYPGMVGGVQSAPWVLFFVPGIIGLALIVIIIREPVMSMWRGY